MTDSSPPVHPSTDDAAGSHRRLDRRTFLFGAGIATLAACSGDEPAASPDSVSVTSADTTTTSTTTSTVDVADTATTTPTTTTAPGDVPEPATGPSALTEAQFERIAVCTLLGETTAGPFPTIEQLDRRDVTEGYPGHPLRLGLRVVDADCRAIEGAAVEIWHTDATGDYSSYEDGGDGKDEGDGSTFLRGFQTSDAAGITEFQTIYPGWYGGRAVHIHVRVRVDDELVLTSQLYFDEAYTVDVFAAAPYAEFGAPDTPWAADQAIGDPTVDGSGITLEPANTTLGPGTLGLANLGVSI